MALVAWYKLNGNVLDSTVNDNHGTIVGSPTVVNDGPFGSCYNFNPENGDYITINNLSSFIYNTPFTFSAWIKTSGLGTGQTINGIITLTYGTRLCISDNGNLYINFLSTNVEYYIITSVGVNLYDNVWHHVCCTYNGDVLKLYIDGNLNVTGVTGIIQTNTYTNNGAIGLDVNNSTLYKFNGSIADTRIYDEALSVKEIKELAKAKVLHYDFNHDTTDDLIIYDKSGYDNNAELDVSTTPTYVNDSIVNKGCYEFDGTKTIIIDNPFGYTNLTQEWTVSTWAYLTTIDETQYLINGLNSGIAITWGATRKSLLYLNSGSNDYYIYGLADKIPVNTWFHISFVFRNSDGLRKIYINGIDESGSGPNLTSTPSGIGSTLEIGKYVKGKLADIRIYSTALSEDDIKELYTTRCIIDKNGNMLCDEIDNGEMIWDSEINSINLVKNGSAELENNTNFESFEYITTDSYDGNGCFYKAGNWQSWIGEFIKINKEESYYLSGYFKSAGSSGLSSRLYYGIDCYDYLKRQIAAYHVCHYTNTETYLVQPINNGDTVIYVNSVANWHISTDSKTTRRIGVYYPELDMYPKYTYTRVCFYYDSIDVENNTITLSSAWVEGNIPAGSAVANHYDANTFQYISASYSAVPLNWTKYINVSPVSGWAINNPYSSFRYGTVYIKLLFLLNFGQNSTYALKIDNLKFWNTKGESMPVKFNIDRHNVTSNDFSEVGPTEGLIAYYPLNGDANDYSGNNNHGTVYGAIKASGIAGKKCYYFDGVDDYIESNTPISNVDLNSSTLSLWIYITNTNNKVFFSSHNGLSVGLYNTSYLILTSLNIQKRLSYTTNLALNSWNHIVVKYIDGIPYVYINNIEEAYYDTPNNWSYTGTGFDIGRRSIGGVGSVYTGGKIQNVRIYNRALSDKEIEILYNLFNPNINKTLQINKENIIYTKGNIKEV